jgi:hypothetical protein
MSSSDFDCHECGAETVGTFCQECGVRVRVTCASCESDVRATANFCHHCGASLPGPESDDRSATGSSRAVSTSLGPWIIVGSAGIVLAIAGGVVILNRQSDQPELRANTPSTSLSSVDLSTMTPREAADRLYNRVMSASEAGDLAEARSFVPMALQAYEVLGPAGVDEHYHIGLLRIVSEDIAGAKTHLEGIRQASPTHLFGFMLAHAIAEAQGDPAAESEAYAGFLSAYSGEINLQRQEYAEHSVGIERFHDRAQAAGESTPPGDVP